MKLKSLHRISRRESFTLLELLVSMAILGIMMLALSTVTSYVSRIWRNGIGTVDNFTKARVVLTLLDRDIQMMVMRRDLAAFVDKNGNSVDSNGNPICAFYTNVQGGSATAGYTPDARTVSLVQYLLNTPSTAPTLQRLNYGMNFSTVAPTVGTTTNLTQLGSANAVTETVFTGIIRFQIQFLNGTGAVQPTFSYSYPQPSSTSNSRTVIVSMLVLNSSAYNLATQSGSTIMTTLLADFPNPAAPPSPYKTYSQYWNSILNPSAGSLDTTLPPMVRGGIQVFERHIPLPITTPTS